MGSVSIVVPFADRWYFREIIGGATARVEQAGHRAITTVVSPEGSRRAADVLESDLSAPDSIGAVLAGFKARPDSAERAKRLPRPIVLVGGSEIGLATVMIDDIGAAREATHHLRSLGHKRIVHLAGNLDNQMDFSVHGRRARGYRQAMEAAGLDADVVETDFDAASANAAARRILARTTPPTAIFAVSDEMAFEVLAVVRELGLRPGHELSVVGIDDHPRAEQEDLTTIRQRPAEMGAAAADMLLSGLEVGLNPKMSRLAQIGLVKRGSTGAYRTF